MLLTVEIRWFFRGIIPEGVQAWFDQIDTNSTQPTIQPARTDVYLLEPGNSSLGIKLREGRIELKQRLREYGPAEFNQDMRGYVEGWRKWSFLISLEQTHVQAIGKLGNSWMNVSKERALFSFQTSGEEIKSTLIPDLSRGGCNLELSQIQAAGEPWWSLGLEAFGDEESNFDRLDIVARHILAKRPPQNLSAQRSFGYPQWLNSRIRGVQGANRPEQIEF